MIQNKMKDKIRNFVFEIEGIGTKVNNHSAKEMPRQISTEKIKYNYNLQNLNSPYDFNSPNANKELKSNSSNNTNALNGNSYKSPKAREEKQIINMFDNKKEKGILLNNFTLTANEDDFFSCILENKMDSSSNALKLKPEDIKNISNKLRFASTDEIRKLDET